MSNMSEKDKKDKDEKKNEKDARARVLETAERAGRHINEAGGMDEITGGSRSVDLKRRQPADLARRFIESLSMDERREILNQLTDQLTVKKVWNHPFNVVVTGKYHQCAKCGKPVGDEVVLVTERLRTGDRHSVFCSIPCLSTYSKW